MYRYVVYIYTHRYHFIWRYVLYDIDIMRGNSIVYLSRFEISLSFLIHCNFLVCPCSLWKNHENNKNLKLWTQLYWSCNANCFFHIYLYMVKSVSQLVFLSFLKVWWNQLIPAHRASIFFQILIQRHHTDSLKSHIGVSIPQKLANTTY